MLKKHIRHNIGLNSLISTALAFCFLALTTPWAHGQQWTTIGNDISNTNTGNVGIGTTLPASALDVHAAGAAVSIGNKDNAGAFLRFLGANTNNFTNWQIDHLNTGNGLGFSPSTTNGGTTFTTPTLYLLGSNVGIGTTGPRSALDAHTNGAALSLGNADNGGAYIRFFGANTNNFPNWQIDHINTGNGLGFTPSTTNGGATFTTPTLYLLGGNVGIGTTNAGTRLTLGSGTLTIKNASSDSDGLKIYQAASDTSAFINYYSGPMVFGTANTERVRIDSSGNVGIGTTTPSAKLHVVGDVTVTGNISARFQDIAEWVPATEPLIPGSVVVLDSQHKNFVRASSAAYDTRVAGVVSATPGIILGEADEGKVKVATTGRVPVRVNANRGRIEVGDLLVTSDKEGVAMKSEPVEFAGVRMHRPGTLIGKALESLESGEGEILVLLSLQ